MKLDKGIRVLAAASAIAAAAVAAVYYVKGRNDEAYLDEFDDEFDDDFDDLDNEESADSADTDQKI